MASLYGRHSIASAGLEAVTNWAYCQSLYPIYLTKQPRLLQNRSWTKQCRVACNRVLPAADSQELPRQSSAAASACIIFIKSRSVLRLQSVAPMDRRRFSKSGLRSQDPLHKKKVEAPFPLGKLYIQGLQILPVSCCVPSWCAGSWLF